MAGLLSAEGYNIVKTPETADLWVLNSCTVKNPSEGNFLHHVQKGESSDQAQKGQEELIRFFFLGWMLHVCFASRPNVPVPP